MKLVLVLIAALLVTGCLRIAAPTYLNGSYYMAGDSDCVQGDYVSSTRIACKDRKGNVTGYRDAISNNEVQEYQVQMNQLNQQMQQTGQTFQNAGQQILQQSQQYTPPQVQPIQRQGTGVTTYRRVGSTWVGTDGSSCQVAGQSILCSNGSTCRLVGQSLICN